MTSEMLNPGAGDAGARDRLAGRLDSPKNSRKTAKPAIRHLGDLVIHHKVNDEKGAHITLWLNRRHRIEWWPGACKWRDPRAGTVQGTAAELVDFLRRQRSASPSMATEAGRQS